MAQRGVNKVILLGNLGKDPDIKYMPNGNAVANITLATSETWNDKSSGEKKEKTEWHRVVFFGKLAEIVGQYLKKGSKIYIEGKLQTRKWQGQDGQDKYTTEVVLQRFSGVLTMLDSPGGGGGGGGYGGGSGGGGYGGGDSGPSWDGPDNGGPGGGPGGGSTGGGAPGGDLDDEIPF